MPQDLTPQAVTSFVTFPIQVPANGPGELVDADTFKDLYDILFGNLEFLNNKREDMDELFENAEVLTGLSFNTQTLPTYGDVSDTVKNKSLVDAIAALGVLADSNKVKLDNVSSRVGGGVTATGNNNWSNTDFFTQGSTIFAAVEALATQAKAQQESTITLSNTSSTQSTQLSRIASKVSADALTSNTAGFTFTAEQVFYASGDNTKQTLDKIHDPLLAHRRTVDFDYKFLVNLWSQINSVTGQSFYETFLNSSNINGISSPGNAYNSRLLEFGSTASTWIYYSNIIAIPATSNQVKVKFDGDGTLTFSVNFSGSFTTGFVQITSQDTWFSIPAGAQMVIKVSGAPGTRLNRYAVLYQTI